jgi:predicted nuclease with TOPRIM domain
MNFYQLDVYEIERYIRNNAIEASTLTEVLLDKLKEVTGNYEQLTEVLDNWKDENKALQDEINVLKETFANS